jgi:hypothetical protein
MKFIKFNIYIFILTVRCIILLVKHTSLNLDTCQVTLLFTVLVDVTRFLSCNVIHVFILLIDVSKLILTMIFSSHLVVIYTL